MAPFSPLPAGFSPRSPKPPHSHPRPYSRPFSHIFGQTLPSQTHSRAYPSPEIICGPESKGWMACLALSCFIVVVWLAALPNVPKTVQVDMVFPDLDLLDQGGGLGLMWAYQEPTPIAGYGKALPKREMDSPPTSLPSLANLPISTIPSQRSGSSALATSRHHIPFERDEQRPTPVPSSTASPTSTASSSMFSAPAYAKEPSAATTDEDDTDTPDDSANGSGSSQSSSSDGKPSSSSSEKPQERRRSRLRNQRANDFRANPM